MTSVGQIQVLLLQSTLWKKTILSLNCAMENIVGLEESDKMMAIPGHGLMDPQWTSKIGEMESQTILEGSRTALRSGHHEEGKWNDRNCDTNNMRGFICKEYDCPSGWSKFQEKCYRYFSEKITWTEARDFCRSKMADLPSINFVEENDFVSGLCLEGVCWLGGRRGLDDRFYWNDGALLGFTNWRDGEPNDWPSNGGGEDCMEAVGKEWNDIPCSRRGGVVCEMDRGRSGKIKKNSELATIHNWGPTFRISFDLIIYSAPSGWSSVLAFKGNGAKDDLVNYGDRVPAIFYNNPGGYLHIASAVSGNRNLWINQKIELGKRHHLTIVQEVDYSVSIDGEVVFSEKNTDRRTFHYVKVFAGDNFYPPANGRYENLSWKTGQ